MNCIGLLVEKNICFSVRKDCNYREHNGRSRSNRGSSKCTQERTEGRVLFGAHKEETSHRGSISHSQNAHPPFGFF